MVTYYIYYKIKYFRNWNEKRRVTNFNRRIENIEDIQFIENEMRKKMSGDELVVVSFTELEENYDNIVYSLDEEWE